MEIGLIAKHLKKGSVIIIPTETVYGLAADSKNKKAVERIFKIKGRKKEKKLALAVASFKMLKKITKLLPKNILSRLKKVLPGPLTFIYYPSAGVPKYLISEYNTIAVRFADNKYLNKAISLLGRPLVLTSANRSGGRSPVRLSDTKTIWKEVDFIIGASRTKYGKESTVLDITKNPPKILRAGVLKSKKLKNIGLL